MKNRKEEQQADLAHLLNTGGCPVQVSAGYHVPSAGLIIEQIPEPGLNTVFDLANGGAGFLLDIIAKNERSGPLWIDGFQITVPWGRATKSLVPAPRKSNLKYPYYGFPDSSLMFDGSEVVNRFFSTRRRLNGNEEINGLLMAVDSEPIPDSFEHNSRVAVTFTIFDRRGNSFSKDFQLAVDRTERRIQARKAEKQASRSSSVSAGLQNMS